MQWLMWARKLQALAQTGLAYGKDPFDLERYKEIRQIAVEIATTHVAQPKEQLASTFANETGYATPKVGVRAAVFRDGRILLVRERRDGAWSLPGGWADVGQSPSEMAIKEVREESGYEVRPTKLLAVLDRDKQGHPPMLAYVYTIIMRCELVGGAPTTSIETDGVDFFDRDQLPPLSVSRVTAAQITRLFEHYDNPDLPADFD